MAQGDLTLIGPTTGIQGIFHGAWWYYYLALPYVLFQGHPLGFSLFIFLTFLIVSIYFSIFLKKEFGELASLIFLILAAASPYLIQISFFAISSAPEITLFLILFYLTYLHLKKDRDLLIFLIFLTLGFILETELPTGIFLIPSYLLTIFLTRTAKRYFGNLRKIYYSFFGLLIPVSLRILSEFKNNFLQTKTILNFLSNDSSVKKTLMEVFFERYQLFWDYYLRLFNINNFYLEYILLITTIIGIVFTFLKSPSLTKKYLLFILFFLIIAFSTSLFYKNIVWQNYLEGLSLFYILIMAISFSSLIKNSNFIIRTLPSVVFSILILFNFQIFLKDLKRINFNPREISLREQVLAVNYIYDNTQGDFCARVYTPPVIPYTYNYLFDYYSRTSGYQEPDFRYKRGQCWLILEKDNCRFAEIEKKEKMECEARIENWKVENTIKDSFLVEKKIINKKLSVELWKRK